MCGFIIIILTIIVWHCLSIVQRICQINIIPRYGPNISNNNSKLKYTKIIYLKSKVWMDTFECTIHFILCQQLEDVIIVRLYKYVNEI